MRRVTLLSMASMAVLLLACSKKAEPANAGADAGGVRSMACYIGVQFRCKELPAGTAQQLADLPGECSSASGVLTSPAACPTEKFVGKCTVGTAGKDNEVRRSYTGADAVYDQDFCVSTAHGTWSTTF